MRELGKLALADFTAIGFDAQMNASVLREVRGIGKGFGALRALVGFGLTAIGRATLGMVRSLVFVLMKFRIGIIL